MEGDPISSGNAPADERVPSEPQAPSATRSAYEPPRRSGGFLWGLLAGCLTCFAIVMIVGLVTAIGSGSNHYWTPGAKVAVIPIEGEIVDSREAIEDLREYRDDDGIKAVVLRINSPGGGVVPAQEIYEEISKFRRESGKPVVASLATVAASGGYYIASAADRIVANPGSLTGSIGVIAQWFNIEDLAKWARLKPETITAGRMKDAGSPFRAMTDAERAYLQQIATELHQQFIHAVAVGRNGRMTEEQVREVADGRVFTGEQAKTLKLVDELGNLEDAVRAAAKLAHISGEPHMLYPKPRKPGLVDLLTESNISKNLISKMSGKEFPFLYRWQ